MQGRQYRFPPAPPIACCVWCDFSLHTQPFHTRVRALWVFQRSIPVSALKGADSTTCGGITGRKEDPMAELPFFSMRQLIEAGCHFGHNPRRWNPKMKSYLFGVRDGVHIIDLQQSVPLLQRAMQAI